GERRVAPFLRLGTLLAGTAEMMTYGRSLTLFDAFIVKGNRTFMETCSLPSLAGAGISAFIETMETAPSPGCGLITHEFRGAASRVPVEATAFGNRQDHLVVEILAAFPDRSAPLDEQRHRLWAREALEAFDAMALPGAYPNFLTGADADRVARSYGPNAS